MPQAVDPCRGHDASLAVRAYPRYRDSGVEWLGEVPEHWEVKRLKLVASTNDETLSESEDPLRPIAYVDIGSVDSTIGITEMEEMVFEDAPSRARRLVRDGDTIEKFPPSGLICVRSHQCRRHRRRWWFRPVSR